MVIEPFEFNGFLRAGGFIAHTLVNVCARYRNHISHTFSAHHLTCHHSAGKRGRHAVSKEIQGGVQLAILMLLRRKREDRGSQCPVLRQRGAVLWYQSSARPVPV